MTLHAITYLSFHSTLGFETGAGEVSVSLIVSKDPPSICYKM
jgi:hypothetical protein